jgi:transcriptional regulator with XRE-family HTH domain
MRGRTLNEYISEQIIDSEFKMAWDSLDTEYELLESIIEARERAGITQDELAKKIGTKQSAISRLEHGGFSKATVETLHKIAEALDAKLVIKMESKNHLVNQERI